MPSFPSDPRPDLSSEPLDAHPRQTLLVFCHLRWGFVFQRPQHLLTRLAKEFDVVFVEEPVFHDAAPSLRHARQAAGVEVLTPLTNVQAWGFNDEQMALMRPLLADFLRERRIVAPLVWLYTPMALPLVAGLGARAVVYDCMDDLASFKFAPPELLAREHALMAVADVVFTGGPSLYEARKDSHPNIHCLPSAVDAAHFDANRLDDGSPEGALARELHRGMEHPRLGFFGVIDERLDIALLEGLADARPDWHIVMAGPVVKIDPATLPQRPNLHWIGMQRYETLPHLLAQWDVCLLPFALNEATRFISPTKTLEYLAGGRPAVSTPIHDVVSLYGAVVRIGETASDFVDAIERTLAESPAQRAQWRAKARAVVDACTWDATAERIAALLRVHVRGRAAEAIVLDGPLPAALAAPPGREAPSAPTAPVSAPGPARAFAS